MLITLCCGKRKPPLPPVESVNQRAAVTGFQRGNQVLLSWQMPARNTAEGSVLNIDRISIYRLVEPLSSPRSISEEEFSSRSTLIDEIKITDDDFALKRLSYTDRLQFAGQSVRLRYAIRFVNASGQKAAFSNFLLIEPAANIAVRPEALTALASQESILLNWTAPAANVDGSTPANVLGYNIYRSGSKNETAKLLNEAPIGEAEFRDRFFEFGKEYFYFVRAVSVGANGEPTESSESEIISIVPKDTFAPTAPTALTVAAAPGNISIFFAANPENDIDGYLIYRSTDANLDKSEWLLITPEPIKTTTFQDSNVQADKTFFYYVKAIDTRGNQSPPSEVVSETAR